MSYGFSQSHECVAFLWKIVITIEIENLEKKHDDVQSLPILTNQRARCQRVVYIMWLFSVLQVCGFLQSNGIMAFLWEMAINGDI